MVISMKMTKKMMIINADYDVGADNDADDV